jgi:hypothetical protein
MEVPGIGVYADSIFSICCLFTWHLACTFVGSTCSKNISGFGLIGEVIDFSPTEVQTFAGCSKNLTINHILHTVRNKVTVININLLLW